MEDLFAIVKLPDAHDRLEAWSVEKRNAGHSKQAICNHLLAFFVAVQKDPRTNHNDDAYDTVADFLDRFTDWGKHFRIFLDEPDVEDIKLELLD